MWPCWVSKVLRNWRPTRAMMPPRMIDVSTCPIDAKRLVRAVRMSDQRWVRATTASGTQWSGMMECKKPTTAAAMSSRGIERAVWFVGLGLVRLYHDANAASLFSSPKRRSQHQVAAEDNSAGGDRQTEETCRHQG